MKTQLRSIQEINDKIKKGQAVVLNAVEMTRLVKEKGAHQAAKEVDIVTTGTFSPMCSSGLLFNFGQQPPTIKASKVWINDVPAYGGLAAVDSYLGATESTEGDPLNKVYPGEFKYGGAHVIEDLVAGKSVRLRATSYGTDCYPRTNLEKVIHLKDLPYAELLNPRNCYQNYNCAVNATSKLIYTYMGPLRPNFGNANYATSGELSPLFNDPYCQTIGLGTRIFMGGGIGYVIGAGTQHNSNPPRNEYGIPLRPAGTLMLKGNLKNMRQRFVRGLSLRGYGVSLALGVGIPIPILNEDIAKFTGISDEQIQVPVVDYGLDYHRGIPSKLGHVTFQELKSGEITINDKKIPTTPLTSYVLSLEIAQELKEWIKSGKFLLTEAQEEITSI